MELPHYTLYIRRLTRLPMRATVVILLSWLAILLVQLSIPSSILMKEREYAVLGILLLGHFVLFHTIATGMSALTENMHGIWGWHVAPLDNSKVLLGTLAATGVAAIIPALGLIAYISLYAFSTLDYGLWTNMLKPLSGYPFSHHGYWSSLYFFLLFFVVRLAHFALLAGCLQLAFRKTKVAFLIPSLLAGTATIAALWSGRELFQISGNRLVGSISPWLMLLIGMLGAAAVMLLILLAVRRRGFSLPHLLLTILLFVVPLAMGGSSAFFALPSANTNLSSLLQLKVYRIVYRSHFPLHAALGHMYPNLEAVWLERVRVHVHRRGYYQQSEGVRYQWYAKVQDNSACLAWVLLGYLASLSLWWLTALLCLDMARNPQKYVRLRL